MEMIIKIIADWLMVPVFLIAIVALLVRVPSKQRYDRYLRIFMAGVTSYGLAKYIGFFWQPEQLRPFEKLGVDAGAAYLDNPGFPSDHVLFATFLALAVWYGTRNRFLAILMIILVALVAAGRVMALVHTPLDVVGGAVVAIIGGVWYISYAKNRINRRLAEKANK